MKNPAHPGGFVLRECIEPLGLSITAASAALGVTRTTLPELVNGKRGELAGAAGAVRSRAGSNVQQQAEAAGER
jgi:addiction module HigA family antidote